MKKFLYKIKRLFIKEKPKYLPTEYLNALKENIKYKNIHSGKRCFVLGNGPSLKDLDPSLLKDEYVFTVNQIARFKNFEQFNTNYHFWIDPAFFKFDKDKQEDLELLEVFKSVKTSNNTPTCFFSLRSGYNFVTQHELSKHFNVSFLCDSPYEDRSIGFIDNEYPIIDATSHIPGFHNVVQWATAMAIYMGFSEIYLLGCDCTNLMVTIKSALKSNDSNDYAYEISPNEKRRMENLLKTNSLEQYTLSYLETLRGFRWLNGYCNTHGIKLINLSTQTVIDNIPRDTIENVLKNGQKK